MEESYGKAKEVISANIDGLRQLAEQLLEKEVIFSEDLERIFGKRKGDHTRDLSDGKPAPEIPALPEIPSMPEIPGIPEIPVTPESPEPPVTRKTPEAPASPVEHGE